MKKTIWIFKNVNNATTKRLHNSIKIIIVWYFQRRWDEMLFFNQKTKDNYELLIYSNSGMLQVRVFHHTLFICIFIFKVVLSHTRKLRLAVIKPEWTQLPPFICKVKIECHWFTSTTDSVGFKNVLKESPENIYILHFNWYKYLSIDNDFNTK